MSNSLKIRPASPGDSGDLAIIADMATRGLSSFLWTAVASEGKPPFEIWRSIIRGDQANTIHHSNWLVAQSRANVLGAVNGYTLSRTHLTAPTGPSACVLEPLNELKGMAIGTWYIAAIAVFPEARGRSVGSSLLRFAEQAARAASVDEITLMVGSFNPRARNLYESIGFKRLADRTFQPFRGSDPEGYWVLMSKTLKGRTG
ncbi:GNAT family N-acetyltransferase [Pontivivens insulae]|uniref:Mycothiol acetyltransferase n=1 Tax=Pontivivens insulae TaxID=1639689 RepID=A0A2R8A939_9RHOB|nr:GNAT family N-acetyltransferase [Pontivivens insulae]RED18839.1 acetyltransferase (GNAT) family protein [Pontivivens insulae]SPF28739.1 Mycothiol acetyltransferase [Pontivivens insulae]